MGGASLKNVILKRFLRRGKVVTYFGGLAWQQVQESNQNMNPLPVHFDQGEVKNEIIKKRERGSVKM